MPPKTQSDPFEPLRSTLSKIYPIEKFSSVLTPDASGQQVPRFCWNFYRPDSYASESLRDAIKSYSGEVHWFYYGSAGQTCIASSNADVSERGGARAAAESFVAKAVADVPGLCRHIESVLNLENAQEKTLNEDLRFPPPATEVIDFSEPGTHVVWIVASPDEFAVAPHLESSDAKRLHFGVIESEWQAIYAQVFGWEPNRHIAEPEKTEAREFPVLSSIPEFESWTLESTKIEALREECFHARRKTSSPDAIRGLDKLILICNWARLKNQGIYLVGP